MTCETCNFELTQSCKFFYNDYSTNLLCIFKQLPNELIRKISEYIYHYKGHKVNDKLLCTSCFQLGYYKLIHSKKIITRYNILNYFDSWIDDYYTNEVREFCKKQYLVSHLDIIIFYEKLK